MYSVYAPLVKSFNVAESMKDITEVFKTAAQEFDVVCTYENKDIIRDHIRVKGEVRENVQEVLALLEDTGFITNELQVSCSIRELNYCARIGIGDLALLQAAMIACQVSNCLLSYDAGDRYILESETKFAVMNALAYINPLASESTLDSLVQEQ